jgi:hypothetical protein
MSDLRSIEESDFDADALTYIRAVEEADGAYLETDVKVAINKLVVGLKFDSLWGSIGASCLLCGPRTLAGALVPLKGPAPQNNNFGSDNYNRETGLVGDATQTYLAIPYALSSDPNTDNHHCIVVTEPPSGSTAANASILGTGNRTITWNSPNYQGRNTVPFTYTLGEATAYPNFIGMARKPSPSQLHLYMNASLYTISQAAEATPTGDLTIFRNNSGGAMSDPRLSFFSVGRFLELPVLDSHITAYITAIGAAL